MKMKKLLSLLTAAAMGASCIGALGITAAAKTTNAEIGRIYNASEICNASGNTDTITPNQNEDYYTNTLGAPFGAFADLANYTTQSSAKDSAAWNVEMNYSIDTAGTYTFSVFVVEFNNRYPDIKLGEEVLLDGDATSSLTKLGSYGTSRSLAVLQVPVTITEAGSYTITMTNVDGETTYHQIQGVIAAVLTSPYTPSDDTVTLTYKGNRTDFTGGNPNDDSYTYSFVSGADAKAAALFADSSDSTKVNTELTATYLNYVGGTGGSAAHPSLSLTAPAGSYKLYYLGYNNESSFTATLTNAVKTFTVSDGDGVQFAAADGHPERILKLYTMDITLDSDASADTLTFDTTASWLPDLYAVIITNQKDETEPVSADAYTMTWYFGRGNGAPDIALEGSADYAYTVADADGVDRTITVDTTTNGGKLNNTSRTDNWAQCNDGTTFKVQAYNGMKITYKAYNSGDTAGFKFDGVICREYVYVGDTAQISFTASGVAYLDSITVAPCDIYSLSGTISVPEGAEYSVAGNTLSFKGSKGQTFSTTVGTDGAYSLVVPADTYTASVESVACLVARDSQTVTVAGATTADIATETAAARQLAVTLINPPSEGTAITFTPRVGNNTAEAVFAAGETEKTIAIMPGTYDTTSSNGTISERSKTELTIAYDDTYKNIYYPAEIAAAAKNEVTVGKSGCDYATINDALAALKKLNPASATIILNSGETYREQVTVSLPNVTFKTNGSEKAKVTWYYGVGYTYYSVGSNGYYDKDLAMTKVAKLKEPSNWGAVLTVSANNFKAENIIFENSFNQYYTEEEVADGVVPTGTKPARVNPEYAADSRPATERAAAIYVGGSVKGCELYDCEFISSQDTFGTNGTMYVKDCTIIGNTDYICGGGNCVFDNCSLLWGGYSDQNVGGYITASHTGSGESYIFRNCTIGDCTISGRKFAHASYGRDWGGADASVYFLNCTDATSNGVSGWSDMGGAVKTAAADLHVYDFTNPAKYTASGTNEDNINKVPTFEEAKAKYEGVVSALGFTPERILNASTGEMASAADKTDTVYGVVTTLQTGETSALSGISWIITDGTNAYTVTAAQAIAGQDKGVSGSAVPKLSGGVSADVIMMFHADKGSYSVLSQAQ